MEVEKSVPWELNYSVRHEQRSWALLLPPGPHLQLEGVASVEQSSTIHAGEEQQSVTEKMNEQVALLQLRIILQ